MLMSAESSLAYVAMEHVKTRLDRLDANATAALNLRTMATALVSSCVSWKLPGSQLGSLIYL